MKKHTALKQNIKNDTCIEFRRDIKARTLLADTTDRQTAGLAFGGTGLCSYRVRGVGGSRAEHLTVESYTIIISLQSYLLLLVFHHPLTLSL